MSFLSYENARPWAKAMKVAVLTKKMPPWFADPQFGRKKSLSLIRAILSRRIAGDPSPPPLKPLAPLLNLRRPSDTLAGDFQNRH